MEGYLIVFTRIGTNFMANKQFKPGPIAFFGSGETAPNGRKVFEALFKKIPQKPRVSLLETPAGFELNSPLVAGKIADYLNKHLQNFNPEIQQIPARKKGTPESPDNPELLEPMLASDLLFLGPGSPTYAVHQLRDSLAWSYLRAMHLTGTGLALASASTLAVSAYTLPVYEIYKVGMDIHWQPGLNLFSSFNLSVSFIPHWNNTEGGDDLDTSRCFIGKARFNPLFQRLPRDHRVIGIDEHTGLIFDFNQGRCEVIGLGSITVKSFHEETTYPAGSSYPISDLGEWQIPEDQTDLTENIWKKIQEKRLERKQEKVPSPEIIKLADKRQTAREQQDWQTADQIRDQLADLGWEIQDEETGYKLQPD
jgi:hypothetical protein